MGNFGSEIKSDSDFLWELTIKPSFPRPLTRFEIIELKLFKRGAFHLRCRAYSVKLDPSEPGFSILVDFPFKSLFQIGLQYLH
mmetsp:Transcript_20462/g.20192  ORF Transcript_20462/g.20192 Transcript_20462/m.20192 type:complete len:83 (+) Transcript_20462:123-371(+)